MTVRFTKMHGLGNDFVIIDAVRQTIDWPPETIAELARRDTGIGFDQCLFIEKSREEGIDFFYRIFNANGQEVGQCGNGARCLALFASHYGLTDKKIITVATQTTRMQLHINSDNTVTVNMGRPQLDPVNIPLQAAHRAPVYNLVLHGGLTYPVHALSVGNPHAVSVVENLEAAPVKKLGKQISEHPFFPEQANAGFMQVIDKNHIALRVYERGCGETQACGSGAVAAAAIGRLFYELEPSIHVHLPGGELIVDWPDTKDAIYLRGPATFVYEGVLL
ncbi:MULTISPECIES: diaminopimelate epimerase [unclassified Legionella]|uniref:diaminopimelate epimerase n=1 Tax=unclassified Legionella TaxID=2622702 RepID=UPI001054A4E2|nr:MULTISPECIES: diaminopimelate epimerase [unclassified Legionella]MDI9818732.1 diaminopimelate epimerase [Legionella sp. PL877]